MELTGSLKDKVFELLKEANYSRIIIDEHRAKLEETGGEFSRLINEESTLSENDMETFNTVIYSLEDITGELEIIESRLAGLPLLLGEDPSL